MQKFIKLTFLSLLLLTFSISSSDAAFPKAKETKSGAVVSSSPEVTEAPVSKAELKKELSNLKKENAQGGSHGGSKSKIVAALLAFFLGGFGIHRFYMGQKTQGFMQLGGTLVGFGLYIAGIASYVSGAGEAFPVLALIGLIIIFGVSLWAFIDFIRILTGGLAPEEGFND